MMEWATNDAHSITRKFAIPYCGKALSVDSLRHLHTMLWLLHHLLESFERATMIFRHITAQMCAVILELLLFDPAEVMELCHQIPAIVRNDHVEGIKLCHQRVADAAQQFINTRARERRN